MKIRVSKVKEDKGELTGLLLSFLLLLVALVAFAIEGRYPPSVEYLEENYGVQIDHDKYNVFYDGFASNIMPEITVILAEQEDAVK